MNRRGDTSHDRHKNLNLSPQELLTQLRAINQWLEDNALDMADYEDFDAFQEFQEVRATAQMRIAYRLQYAEAEAAKK